MGITHSCHTHLQASPNTYNQWIKVKQTHPAPWTHTPLTGIHIVQSIGHPIKTLEEIVIVNVLSLAAHPVLVSDGIDGWVHALDSPHCSGTLGLLWKQDKEYNDIQSIIGVSSFQGLKHILKYPEYRGVLSRNSKNTRVAYFRHLKCRTMSQHVETVMGA